MRRVRRQDRLQQNNASDQPLQSQSPSSRSPIRHVHLHFNPNDFPTIKTHQDNDLALHHDEHLLDEHQNDFCMDMNSTNQLFSTSMENFNSNSQSGFGNYLNSISFNTGDEPQETKEMISPTTVITTADSGGKRKKKSEKDMKNLKCGACGAQGHMRTNRVCPMYGKTSGGNSQTNLNVENEDAQHSFDLSHNDMNIGDVSVKMVEGAGTKLIFAKSLLDKSASKDSGRKSKKNKSKSVISSELVHDDDNSISNSQSAPIMTDRPPTPPPIVHVSTMSFIPPLNSSSSSPPINLTYTPKSSGTLKTTLSHTGHRRKSSTTPNTQLKHSQSYANPALSSTPTTGGPLGTMFSFPPNTPTTPTPSSAGIDYLDKRARTVQRRRIDPLVSFASLLETILNELRDMPEVNYLSFVRK